MTVRQSISNSLRILIVWLLTRPAYYCDRFLVGTTYYPVYATNSYLFFIHIVLTVLVLTFSIFSLLLHFVYLVVRDTLSNLINTHFSYFSTSKAFTGTKYCEYGEDKAKELINKDWFPHFLTGLVDGDGNFSIVVRNDNSNTISLIFSISTSNNPENVALFRYIQAYFKAGSINALTKTTLQFSIRSLTELSRVVEHFKNFPLESQKMVHFRLWSEVYEMMIKNLHLTREGKEMILSIKSAFPGGLTKLNQDILSKFPNIVLRDKAAESWVRERGLLHPAWISGFTTADGTFGLHYISSRGNFQPAFRISQKFADVNLLKDILSYFNSSNTIHVNSTRNSEATLSITNHEELHNAVVPHFINYPILGSKALDFSEFATGIEIIHTKEHMTLLGREKLLRLYYGMNSYRYKTSVKDMSEREANIINGLSRIKTH